MIVFATDGSRNPTPGAYARPAEFFAIKTKPRAECAGLYFLHGHVSETVSATQTAAQTDDDCGNQKKQREHNLSA